MGHKVEDDAAVGVSIGGVVEEGDAVRRVGDVVEGGGAGGGLGVAGVGVGVAEGVDLLERGGGGGGCIGGGDEDEN